MKQLLIACLMSMIGCGATSSNEIITKNGKKGFAIECSIEGSCGNIALASCPTGFSLLSRDGSWKIVIECLP